jgi:hypothetical protein
MDFLETFYASSIRDAECHDPLFSSFSWNCTQNVGREGHRSATPGIAGCLTPGGDFFIPHRGRPLLGCERLLAQGIPYFRLMLGNLIEFACVAFLERSNDLTCVPQQPPKLNRKRDERTTWGLR